MMFEGFIGLVFCYFIQVTVARIRVLAKRDLDLNWYDLSNPQN